jgi:hypothetical protein
LAKILENDTPGGDCPIRTTATELSLSLLALATRYHAHYPADEPIGENDRFRSPTVDFHMTGTSPFKGVDSHTLIVGSANFVPEVESSSRTITVQGTHVSSVVVGDAVPHKAVHVNAHVHHRSFLALADSGAAVSCVNTTTYDTIRRRCPGTPLAYSTKPFMTYDANYLDVRV